MGSKPATNDHLDIMVETFPDGRVMTPCRPHKRQCYDKEDEDALQSKLADPPKATTDAVKASMFPICM